MREELRVMALVMSRLRKRKEFEDGIRRNRHAMPLWIKYATWEETQLEFDRFWPTDSQPCPLDPYRHIARAFLTRTQGRVAFAWARHSREFDTLRNLCAS